MTCAIICSYEDHTALHGGKDGLDVIRNILAFSELVLDDGG